MNKWRRECAELRVIYDEARLFDAAQDMAASLGFDALVFALLIPTSLTRPLFRVFGTTFEGQDRVDPRMIQKLMRGNPAGGPWSAPGTRRAAPWLDSMPSDLTHGWTQPTRGAGMDMGMTTFARASGALEADEIDRLELRLIYLSQALHCQMMTLATEGGGLYETPTADELAVLRWAGDGKTAEDIARILGLQVRSVNYLATLARTKLRTNTTIQAAIRAQAFGLL